MTAPADRPAPAEPPVLTDGRVTLRALGEEHVAGCLEQALDPESIRWTTVPVPSGVDTALEFCTEIAPRAWADGSQWILAIECDEVPGRYCGNLALRPEGPGLAEIGYGAAPAARGLGIMEAGVRLALEWGFEQQGLQVVRWGALVGNWASRRLAWKVGFSYDGLQRGTHVHRGELRDAWSGTLHRDEPRVPRHRWFVPPVLEDPVAGVRLRQPREADLPRIVEACSDERTSYWLGSMPVPYTETDARAWLAGQDEGAATGTKVPWVVADAATDALLGAINLFDVSLDFAEVGYWAHPDARGRGMMTAATRLATTYAFEEVGVRRVALLAALENTASRHVAEACGFTLTGHERLGTTLRTGRADVALYDVLAEEWPSRV